MCFTHPVWTRTARAEQHSADESLALQVIYNWGVIGGGLSPLMADRWTDFAA